MYHLLLNTKFHS